VLYRGHTVLYRGHTVFPLSTGTSVPRVMDDDERNAVCVVPVCSV